MGPPKCSGRLVHFIIRLDLRPPKTIKTQRRQLRFGTRPRGTRNKHVLIVHHNGGYIQHLARRLPRNLHNKVTLSRQNPLTIVSTKSHQNNLRLNKPLNLVAIGRSSGRNRGRRRHRSRVHVVTGHGFASLRDRRSPPGRLRGLSILRPLLRRRRTICPRSTVRDDLRRRRRTPLYRLHKHKTS